MYEVSIAHQVYLVPILVSLMVLYLQPQAQTASDGLAVEFTYNILTTNSPTTTKLKDEQLSKRRAWLEGVVHLLALSLSLVLLSRKILTGPLIIGNRLSNMVSLQSSGFKTEENNSIWFALGLHYRFIGRTVSKRNRLSDITLETGF